MVSLFCSFQLIHLLDFHPLSSKNMAQVMKKRTTRIECTLEPISVLNAVQRLKALILQYLTSFSEG